MPVGKSKQDVFTLTTIVSRSPEITHTLLQMCVDSKTPPHSQKLHARLPFPCSPAHLFARMKQYALLNVCNQLQSRAHLPFCCSPTHPFARMKKNTNICAQECICRLATTEPLSQESSVLSLSLSTCPPICLQNINIPPSLSEEIGQFTYNMTLQSANYSQPEAHYFGSIGILITQPSTIALNNTFSSYATFISAPFSALNQSCSSSAPLVGALLPRMLVSLCVVSKQVSE
jgi:hypothetical protein